MAFTITILIASVLFWAFARYRMNPGNWFYTHNFGITAGCLVGITYSIIIIVLWQTPFTAEYVDAWAKGGRLNMFCFVLLFTVFFFVLMPYRYRVVRNWVGGALLIPLCLFTAISAFFTNPKDSPIIHKGTEVKNSDKGELFTAVKGEPTTVEQDNRTIDWTVQDNILLKFTSNDTLCVYRIKPGTDTYPEYVSGVQLPKRRVLRQNGKYDYIREIPRGFLVVEPENVDETLVSIRRH